MLGVVGQAKAQDLLGITADFTFEVGTAITGVALPSMADSNGTYTVTSFAFLAGTTDYVEMQRVGITFAFTTGAFSGNPTEPAAITFQVQAYNGDTAANAASIRVLAQSSVLSFPTQQEDIAFTAGHARTVALDSAVSGTTPYTYALTRMGGTLPPTSILSLDSTNAMLTASASIARSHAGNYILTVTDADGTTASTAFAITVAAQPSFSASQSRVHFIVSTAGTSQLITASGGMGALSYSLSRTGATVPAALTVHETTAVLSATTSIAAADTGNYTLTATDINGATATVNFGVTVSAALTLPTVPGVSFTIGTPGTVMLPAASGGFAPVLYSLGDGASDSVPGFITNSTRELRYSGATTSAAVLAISFIATDSSPTPQTARAGLAITMLSPPSFAAGDITTLTAGYTFRTGSAITATALPAVAAGAATPLTYKLTAGASSVYGDTAFNNVNGFGFDAGTRMLTGTPLAAMVHSLNYHVRDKNGATASQATSIYVRGALALAQGNLNFNVSQSVSHQLPQATNIIGTPVYELTGTLPSGIAFTAATRTLSGTAPSSTAAATSVTYKVTDGFDSTSTQVVFTIGIVDAPTFTPPTVLATYTRNHPIYSSGVSVSTSGDDLTLPAATVGSGTPTYAELDNSLPSGLSVVGLSGGRQVIRGSPTQAGAFSYARTATDSNGEGTFTLTLHVAAAVAFGGTQSQVYFTAGNGDTVNLTTASGGVVGDLVYSLTRISGTVPAALTIDTATAVLGATGAIAAADSGRYIVTATDKHGATATLTFQVQVDGALGITVGDLNLTIGTAVQLPAASEGRAPFIYSVSGLGSGLTFNPNPSSRTIDGALNIATAADLTLSLTYGIEDVNGATTSDAFTLHIIPLRFATAQRTLRFIPEQAQTENLGDALTSAAGAGTVAYAIDPNPSALNGLTYVVDSNGDPQLIATADFAVADDAVLDYTLTATYIIGTGNTAVTHTATQNITLDVRQGGEQLAPVNEEVISKVAASVVGSTLAAITERIAAANIATPLALIGGQTPQTALASYAKAVADDADDNNALLANSRFVLPFASLPSNANIGAVWGSIQMRELDGDVDAIDWSGDVSGLHLGVDFKVGDNLIGVAVSKNDADIDYKTTDAQGTVNEGEYEVSLTALHPYINRKFGDVDYWASIGLGSGEMTITEKGGDAIKSDLSLSALGAGAGMQIEPGLQLRVEVQTADIDIEGNAASGLLQQDLSTNSIRAMARWQNIYLTPTVPLFAANQTAFFEAGMRRDSGDGESRRAAMEAALGWNYRGQRATIEAAAHGLFGRKDYREWGAYTNVRVSGGDDGQGLSLRIRPSYGEAQGEFGRVWNAESFDDIGIAASDGVDNYALRTETRLSYGIQSANGLVAPFVDAVTVGNATDDIYRLGIDWSPHRYFDVNLTGERRHSNDDADEQRILLQGAVKF